MLSLMVGAAATLELGLGATVTYLEDYVGAGEGQTYVLPFPYIYYRSDKLSIDRNLIRGELAEKGPWRLELSLSGSIPADSDDNRARRGMMDLGWLGSAGPALQYYLDGDGHSDNAFYLELPVRAAVSLDDGDLHGRGVEVEPALVWQRRYQWGSWDLKPTLRVGPRWASRDYHQYYYGVAPEFALADRPAYQAGSGFGGWKLAAGLTLRHGHWWLGAFVRGHELGDASFRDSPLVKDSQSLSGGVALAWVF
ncbi:MipA/OmpV family protein [Gallaecimonas sp. GXIMD4217]|uniref:MipA/OmpV family protein n=1 Tax=Gallaecimonas sp. GXIMD4217 TaxID=3131927 RepID=UPI00311AFAD7